jgi:ubiquinol-cytochrome c reductase cytochrome b subunit
MIRGKAQWFANLAQWFDDRTGAGRALKEMMFRRIPGGARWRYVWGSALTFCVLVQLITGIFLAMHYSASTQTAWESVYYIDHEMTGGWMLRGIHHYTASATMVLMALHLLQVVIHGAYLAPREVNHWIGLAMMLVILGLGQTGYLLPWDQRGYHASQVATTIAGVTPGVGDQARAIALGGSDFGHHTLTRFYALHAGVLPIILFALMVAHLALVRRQSYKAPADGAPQDGVFWPDQAWRNGVVSLATMGTVIFLATKFRPELGPPSDSTVEFQVARPEWYFRFLYQMLKSFEGEVGLFFASQVIPGIVLLVIALMPFVGRWRLGRGFNIAFVLGVLAGIGTMTYISYREDYNGKTNESQVFLAEAAVARAEAQRAHELASMGIPVDGSRGQTRRDPLIAGRRLFIQHCSSCHSHYDPEAENPHDGHPLMTVAVAEPTAANLYGFGSRRWMEGMLDAEQIAGPHYFGKTIMAEGDMVSEVQSTIRDARAELDESEQRTFDMKVQAIAIAISAEAKLPYQQEEDARQTEQIAQGRALAIDEFSCTGCHTLGDEQGGSGPDLTGYASHEWLRDFIKNPQTERFYYNADNYDAEGLMPPFGPHSEESEISKLTSQEIELIVRWLRRDWPVAERARPAAP